MRILHTSDWHLGQYFYGKSRANEHQQFLSWLLAQVTTHDIDIIIVAGDIFDTGTPPSYAREMYFDFIVNLHNLGCQLVVLAGNHDSVAMLSEAKQLLGKLSTHVITIAEPFTQNNKTSEQLLLLTNKNKTEQCVICAIPFIRPRDVIKSQAGQSSDEKQQALQQAISEHYLALFEAAKSLTSQPVPIVMTGHLTTVGAMSSDSVREIYIGTLEAFPANAFPPADYIALGHIHQSQQVAKSDHIRYCGSPIPLSFDEAKQEKSVLMVELSPLTSSENAKLLSVSRLTIPRFQPMVMLKTTLETLNADIKRLVAEQSEITKDKGQTIWLDIEVNTSGYLHDIQGRIDALVADYPIEVLLVRRSKQGRKNLEQNKEIITLNELAVDEVFQQLLKQEIEQKALTSENAKRLTSLFKQVVEQVSLSKNPQDNTPMSPSLEGTE